MRSPSMRRFLCRGLRLSTEISRGSRSSSAAERRREVKTMTERERKETTQPEPKAEKPEKKARSKRVAYSKLREATEDPEAKRLCAILLEVLGGARTPTDAAGVLGVSVPRYYALEARALKGLLEACQRRPKGRKRTAESELLHLRAELRRLQSERDRLGALLRASQRAMGLPAARKPERAAKRRRRRPQVRALRAARSLEVPVAQNGLEPARERREDAAGVKG
jgi:hypothetical protein